MIEVPFTGPPHAKIMLIGEAPGANEERKGEPFVGGSGNILRKLLEDAGITPKECRMGNVCLVRPPSNKFNWFRTDDGRSYYDKGQVNLHNEIKRCKPNVVVALGNEPLQAILGYNKIGNWRGSIVWSEEYLCKVIPTYHPVSVMRQWDHAALLLLDLKKVREESKTLEYTSSSRTLIVDPTFEQVMHELDRMQGNEKQVAFDVETTYASIDEPMLLTAISFCDCKDWAISIPMQAWMDGRHWTLTAYTAIVNRLSEFFASPIPFIAQNAQFDMGVLAYIYGIYVKHFLLDTMCAFHTLYPELPKGLNMLRTTYTNIPYYDYMKSEGDKSFYRYNCLDSIVAFESTPHLIEEMKDFHVHDFYYSLVHPLIPVLLEMQLRGINIDVPLMNSLYTREDAAYNQAAFDLTEEVKKRVGDKWDKVVNPNSTKDLKEILYNILGLPTKLHAKTGNPTTDEKALRTLHSKYPSPIFDLIIKARHTRKMASTYLDKDMVVKGRMHTSYNIGGRIKDDTGKIISGPETGRLSSSASIIINSGTNFQNIPRGEFRKIYLPDDDKVMVSADLSQAEARVVGYEANEKRMIQVFEDPQGDIHWLNASFIYKDVTYEGRATKGTKKQRTFAKNHVHGFNYGEGPNNFAAIAGISVAEGKEMRNKYFNELPMVRARQLNIENNLRKSRIMTNCFGRKRQFYGRWGHDLLKEGYANNPQSTIGDLLNKALVKMRSLLWWSQMDIQLLLQVHDSFILQCHEKDLGDVMTHLRDSFNIPITVVDLLDPKVTRTFSVPVDVQVGRSWGALEDYERIMYE